MNTAEMWLKAQKNGKVYQCHDMAYSAKYGFTDEEDFHDNWQPANFNTIEDIMELDEWEEMSNVMTVDEAEYRFNIKII